MFLGTDHWHTVHLGPYQCNNKNVHVIYYDVILKTRDNHDSMKLHPAAVLRKTEAIFKGLQMVCASTERCV